MFRWLGLCDHQFRLVDWYRPCGNIDFGDLAAAAPALAHFDQSFRRSDDAFRSGVRGTLSRFSIWAVRDIAYWLFPYPNTMGVWPQFRSPLVWDVFAVSTYATVSFLFWYIGLIPDMATLRDRARHRFCANGLRHVGHGLARLGGALVSL